jgi:hypothetical protein
VPLLAISGCSGHSGTEEDGSGASCASEITIAGTTYIGGRGDATDTVTPVPLTGTVVHGVIPPCADGDQPSRPEAARTIPGVRQSDAVVGPGGEVMVAERLWRQPRAALPRELQRYVAR